VFKKKGLFYQPIFLPHHMQDYMTKTLSAIKSQLIFELLDLGGVLHADPIYVPVGSFGGFYIQGGCRKAQWQWKTPYQLGRTGWHC
jgi:hypothetical protein